MASTEPTIAAGSPGPLRRLLRPWLWGLLAVELVVLIIFGVCSYMMFMRNQNVTNVVPEDVRTPLYHAAVWFSTRVLIGYLVVGLLISLLSFLLLVCWRYLRGQSIRTIDSIAWGVGLLLVLTIFKLLEYAVISPFVLMNMWNHELDISIIGCIGDCVPQWVPFVARAIFVALSLTVVVLAALRGLERMPRRQRIRTVSFAAILPVVGLSLGLTAAHDRRPAEPRQDKRPNILILASDGMRPDHLGIYGYELPTSRNIDQLGATAVRFSQCQVPLARTLPSWTSILTSAHPQTHGLRVTWPRECDIALPMPTLADELRKAGYRTAVLSDWAGGDFGKVKYGFDDVHVAPDAWNLYTMMAQGTLQGHPFLVAFADNSLGRLFYPQMVGMPVNPCPVALTDMTIDRLRDFAHQEQPFLMVVFYSETHVPFATRHPYYRAFVSPDYQGPHKVAMYVPDYVHMGQGKMDLKFFDPVQVRALYDGAILSFDDQVGRIMRHLQQLDLFDNTIVIVTADHGEDLFETPTSWGHGLFFLGRDHDNSIPLIISDPQLRQRGQREIPGLVSSMDLMPTLLERLGLPIPPHCEGRSLYQVMNDETAAMPDRTLFYESGVWMGGEPELREGNYLRYPSLLEMLEVCNVKTGQLGLGQRFLDQIVTCKHRMIRDNRWKLIYMPTKDGADYRLYDLQNDPFCVTDVKQANPEIYQRMKDALWQFMLKDAERVRQGDHLVRSGQSLEACHPAE